MIAIFLALLLSFAAEAHAGIPPINELKQLHLTTEITTSNQAMAVIVDANDGRYKDICETIISNIRKHSDVGLRYYTADQIPDSILKEINVIALGNMADNSFIADMYRNYYTFVDLKYPGPDGYVLRTIHNPLATNHNVILIGGSDKPGIKDAAKQFLSKIERGRDLTVGRVMEIKLSDRLSTPLIGADIKQWDVHTWRDSRRITQKGKKVGFHPAGLFGWNPISVAGMLYHMTGKPEYLNTFKELALPREGSVPAILRENATTMNPANPLVDNHHYRSHLLDLVWDLIEESPEFNNQERLYITNKLRERQLLYDPEHNYSMKRSRHGLWHMLNIYTGSRYFAKYYPDKIWDSRIHNIRKGFNALISDPTWGERDTLDFVSTSIEPALEFFILDNNKEFVNSGTARTMMSAIDVLMTGEEVDSSNKYTSISLLHKAAWLLNDERYAWMAKQFGYDFSVFRIGQSYWPKWEKPVPPDDLIGKIIAYPLAESDWRKSGKQIPLDRGFQVLSYHAGLGDDDDFFLLDGFAGMGRNDFHRGALKSLRLDGKNILEGYLNDVDVWVDGMVSQNVPMAVMFKGGFADKQLAHTAIESADLGGIRWGRNILYIRGEPTIVLDRALALSNAHYDVARSWEFPTKIAAISGFDARTSNKVFLSVVPGGLKNASQNSVTNMASLELKQGEGLTMAAVLSGKTAPKIMRIAETSFLSLKPRLAVFGLGSLVLPNLKIEAEFYYLDEKRLFLSQAKNLVVDGSDVIAFPKAMDVHWQLDMGELRSGGIRRLNQAMFGKEFGGKSYVSKVNTKMKGAAEKLKVALNSLARQTFINKPKEVSRIIEVPNLLKEQWQVDLSGKLPSDIIYSGVAADDHAWLALHGPVSWQLVNVDSNGQVLKRVALESRPLCVLRTGVRPGTGDIDVLVGLEDDHVNAYDRQGKVLWSVKTKVHKSFRIGNKYKWPWFTDPKKVFGVYSIFFGDLFGTGRPIIAAGRPNTVEFITQRGELLARVPTMHGTNSSMALLDDQTSPSGVSTLLIGKTKTGIPQLSAIDAKLVNVSNKLYGTIPGNATQMHAWLQRGMSNLVVEDLDGKPGEEVIYALSGHWNELRVYDGRTGRPVWVRYLGPGKSNEDFVRGIALVESPTLHDKHVYVATKMGWLLGFDAKGGSVFRHKFSSPISKISVLGSNKLVVGLEDGYTFLVAAQDIRSLLKMKKRVTGIFSQADRLIVADESGRLRSGVLH